MHPLGRRGSIVMLAGTTVLLLPLIAGFVIVADLRLRVGIVAAIGFVGSGIPASLLAYFQAARNDQEKAPDAPELVRIFVRSRAEPFLAGLWLLLLSVGFYAARFLPAFHPVGAMLMAWLGLLCGIVGILLPIFYLVRPRRLILSPAGLDFTFFRFGTIAWPDVISVEQGEGWKAGLLNLQAMNSGEYAARGFPRRLRASGSEVPSTLIIRSHDLGASPIAIRDAIRLRLYAFGTKRQ